MQILPVVDIAERLGAGLGGGAAQALGQLGQRQMALNALDSLNNLNMKDFSKLGLPQQLATIGKAFAGVPGLQNVMPDVMATFLRERRNLAPYLDQIQGGEQQAPTTSTASAEPQATTRRTVPEGTQRPTKVGRVPETTEKVTIQEKIGGPDPEPYTQEDRLERTAVGPSRESLPSNLPGDLRPVWNNYPNIRAQALRGNPQGLSDQEKMQIEADYVRRGTPPEQARQLAQRTSDYLQGQFQLLQGLKNSASEAIQNRYGKSPFALEIERAAQNEVEKQIDKGLLEPNSIVNSALQKAQNVERTVNRAGDILGRPNFEINLDARKRASQNWIRGLAESGELQTAQELLMKKEIPQANGKTTSGPDWGPARAAEIVQEVANPKGLQKEKKFVSTLPDLNQEQFKIQAMTAPFLDQAPLIKEFKDKRIKGISDLADFIATELDPKDSLITLRNFANERGFTEDEFAKAFNMARELNPEKEFSDYQNYEINNLLPLSIRPSLIEILLEKRSLSERITGKK
jgi:hypothetical protein